MIDVTYTHSLTHSLTGTLDRPRVVAPSKTCGDAVMCDPPGVVGVEPSVVLDLLLPRSVTLALPLRPDVRFTACTSVHSQA